MSNNENEWNGKRRRLHGSCDACRRKKVKCEFKFDHESPEVIRLPVGNSAEMPHGRCTNCINAAIPCINTRAKAEETASAAAELNKSAQAEVAKIATGSYEPPNDLSTCQRLLREVGNYARSLEQALASQSSTSARSSQSPQPENGAISVKYDDTALAMRPLDPLTGYPANDRCYGDSSSQTFSRTAIKHTAENGKTLIVGLQRPDYWTASPWEIRPANDGPFTFPDKALMETLVSIYFDLINPIWNFLHPPTFRQSMAEGLHFTNRWFGAVVLAVCATASRYSNDPRVFIDDEREHSAGWKWFRQLEPECIRIADQDHLCQLQLFALSTLYITSTSQPDGCWLTIGLGIRFGQGLGLHLESTYERMAPLEGELYRRTFWALIFWDALTTAIKGRPGITNTSECTVNLPAVRDYKYWTVREAVTDQSNSIHAFYTMQFRLMPLLERIGRVVHNSRGPKAVDSDIVDLDSALNQWLDEIPQHLKWDPRQDIPILLDQSALLYVTYYHAQLLIHRSFLPTPGNPSPANPTFPSMAICANAARSIGHVLNTQSRGGRGLLYTPYVVSALFDAAIVLLVHVWSVVGDASPEDFNRATVDVRGCLHVLRLYERRWRIAGRYCDILNAVLNIGRHTSETSRGQSKMKRPRGEEDVPSSLQGLPSPPTSEPSIDEQLEALQQSLQATEHLFSLPIRTGELGSLPVYTSWPFDSAPAPQRQELAIDPWLLPQSQSAPSTKDHDDFLGIMPAENDHLFSQEPAAMRRQENLPISYDWDGWAAFLAA
ncbi:Fungal-trans domain-containing protein [Mycena indigotica]|uniref:Fungal-trans domain-containing protein n=1 Tax=Mycena indigotica TaxID=2126181 RepID=A0A8H6VYM4_9AGAR|nr:Fungal-trans domain-containing protein [Mycena indigotica]KAF7298622.1 Fungal-trans domain-containing protein [Mycena indigotica]